MIRILTIVENKNGEVVEYQAAGDLPVEEAAKGLVVVAFNTGAVKEAQARMQAQEQMRGKEPVVIKE